MSVPFSSCRVLVSTQIVILSGGAPLLPRTQRLGGPSSSFLLRKGGVRNCGSTYSPGRVPQVRPSVGPNLGAWAHGRSCVPSLMTDIGQCSFDLCREVFCATTNRVSRTS